MAYVSFVQPFKNRFCSYSGCSKNSHEAYLNFNKKEQIFYCYDRCIQHRRTIHDDDEVVSSRFVLKMLKEFKNKGKEIIIHGRDNIFTDFGRVINNNSTYEEIIEHIENQHETD